LRPPSFIEIEECAGEWFVRVVEHGRETVRNFDLESFAISYAEGERIRLGLEEVVRL
jgi:hypothetical protein